MFCYICFTLCSLEALSLLRKPSILCIIICLGFGLIFLSHLRCAHRIVAPVALLLCRRPYGSRSLWGGSPAARSQRVEQLSVRWQIESYIFRFGPLSGTDLQPLALKGSSSSLHAGKSNLPLSVSTENHLTFFFLLLGSHWCESWLRWSVTSSSSTAAPPGE